MSQHIETIMQKPAPAAASIHLHIERIVIEGGRYTDAQLRHLQGSLERELTRLLRVNSLPAKGRNELTTKGSLPLQTASFTHQSPAELGRAIAQGVYATLRSSGDPQR